jgi:hypothetical protein
VHVGKWLVGVTFAAAIDGAFLGGVAAIISAIGSIVLGVLAYKRGHKTGRSTNADEWERIAREKEAIAAQWKVIAETTGAFHDE